jgi:hypothetical protein
VDFLTCSLVYFDKICFKPLKIDFPFEQVRKLGKAFYFT